MAVVLAGEKTGRNTGRPTRCGRRFTTSVELGVRQDSGDADVGRGLDIGLGLLLADAVTVLAVDVRIRRLLVHEAAGFAKSGMSVSVSYDPTPKPPLGFAARVSPASGRYGMSGAEALKEGKLEMGQPLDGWPRATERG